jgi:hypothetical protein
MATGRLGIADLTATVNTTVYTCPSDKFTVASISVCNRGTQPTTIRLAVASLSTPTNAEYIEFDTELLPKNVLERTGIMLSADQKLVIRSTSSTVSAVAFGIETSVV